MARMTLTEAAGRTGQLLEDATSALTDVTERNGRTQFEVAQGFAEAALARINSVTSEPVVGRGIRIPHHPRYSASAATTLAILDLFPIGGDELLGVAEIAERLRMSRSTVHRYLTTLVALGQLEQPEGGNRKYRRPQIEWPNGAVAQLPSSRSRSRAGGAKRPRGQLAAA
jgi:DNA-binding transcriptional ArsR family regulator